MLNNHPPVWPITDLVIFDCDSTLSRVEGIDELARLTGAQGDVTALTERAMNGDVPLESIYDRRLTTSSPTQTQVNYLRHIYRENVIPDARAVIAALHDPGCTVFIVSGGLIEAVRDFGVWLNVSRDHIQEPPPPDHPLIRHPNVIAVPHLNQNTVESQRETSRLVAEQVLDALRGDDYRSVVNLPFGPGAEYKVYRPYLQLAEKLGKLQGQLAGGYIDRMEVEVQGDGLQRLVRPIAVAILAGMLRPYPAGARLVNHVSAPVIAHEQGIQMKQVVGMELVDYPNLISCRVHWDSGSQTVAEVLFAGGEARLVQYGDIRVDARPEGYLLFLENKDVPGVIGRVGTLLGQNGVNIGEWRLGRDRPGGRAISFINLDSACPRKVLDQLRQSPEIYAAKLVKL